MFKKKKKKETPTCQCVKCSEIVTPEMAIFFNKDKNITDPNKVELICICNSCEEKARHELKMAIRKDPWVMVYDKLQEICDLLKQEVRNDV